MPLTTLDPTTLRNAGCKLVDPVPLFVLLCGATRNDPCDQCNYRRDGRGNHIPGACPAYEQLHTTPVQKRKAVEDARVARETSGGLVGGRWAGMTSKQIREAEGITSAEFQLRKQRGDYRS